MSLTDEGPSVALTTLCALLDASVDLQGKVKVASNPGEVLEIAKGIDCEISMLELRLWSRDLSAAYFPWTGMGYEQRRSFFNGRP